MTKRAQLAVIGAGALGRRHLQGLLSSQTAADIHVIDPVRASLELARAATEEIDWDRLAKSVHYADQLDALPRTLDIAVVATSSNTRFDVTMALLDHAKVHNLILEKILFQNLDHYDPAIARLREAGTRCWVNTARRVMPAHHGIREFFADNTILKMTAFGGLWGLATSAIHLIDFLDFLQPGSLSDVDFARVDRTIIDSKRAGFVEFSGTLQGRIGPAAFDLTAHRDARSPLLITIHGESKTCILNEQKGRVAYLDPSLDEGWRQETFAFPFISQTTGLIADAIMEGAPVHLPDIERSAMLHRPLLEAAGAFIASQRGGSPRIVPMT